MVNFDFSSFDWIELGKTGAEAASKEVGKAAVNVTKEKIVGHFKKKPKIKLNLARKVQLNYDAKIVGSSVSQKVTDEEWKPSYGDHVKVENLEFDLTNAGETTVHIKDILLDFRYTNEDEEDYSILLSATENPNLLELKDKNKNKKLNLIHSIKKEEAHRIGFEYPIVFLNVNQTWFLFDRPNDLTITLIIKWQDNEETSIGVGYEIV
ncbi:MULTISPECIES: hypothetical protein [Bacillus cereus group]|uniref:Uncharacterized protein n=1 Tax=Bacillus wiedmannii TaxID=1890302 RepID=A0A2B6SE70_9BACI|nr:hypothetical protein [Bacillus wiedmannii]PGD39749.1 hypothetical protein COM27_02085 [Bacillus wiedmannii]